MSKYLLIDCLSDNPYIVSDETPIDVITDKLSKTVECFEDCKDVQSIEELSDYDFIVINITDNPIQEL